MLNHMVEYPRSGLDATYAALSHPVRRAIVERLEGDERRVTELAAEFDVSLAAVSKHIRVLEDAGLVRREKRGREHRLSLVAEPLGEAADWIERSRRFWSDRLDVLDGQLRDAAG